MNSEAPSGYELNYESIKKLEKKLEARLDRIENRVGLQYEQGGRCDRCQHWEELKMYDSKLGKCKALNLLEESTYWTEEFKLKLQLNKEYELAFISGERYKSHLVTQPSFSCVNYTPK